MIPESIAFCSLTRNLGCIHWVLLLLGVLSHLSCVRLFVTVDSSPPGSFVHGIL